MFNFRNPRTRLSDDKSTVLLTTLSQLLLVFLAYFVQLIDNVHKLAETWLIFGPPGMCVLYRMFRGKQQILSEL